VGRRVTDCRAAVAVRFLDDGLDVTRFPLARQRQEALATRRIGLGITGLADALCMLGLRYDSDAARELAGSAMRTVCTAAYAASAEMPFTRRAQTSVRATR
jgi:ribonucleoside-diphosphate reductase alpha chain